jgi:hypothetical protein
MIRKLIGVVATLAAIGLVVTATPSQAASPSNGARTALVHTNHITVFDGDKWSYTVVGSWWSLYTGNAYMWCFTENYQYGPYAWNIHNSGSAPHPFKLKAQDFNGTIYWEGPWVWLDPGQTKGFTISGPALPVVGQSKHLRVKLWTDLDGSGPGDPSLLIDANPWDWPDLNGGAVMHDVGNVPCPT